MGILLLEPLGWRGLFMIGALPILLLPIAWFKLPESPQWLMTRGHRQRAFALALKTGNALYEVPAKTTNPSLDEAADQRTGFVALITKKYLFATAILGFVSFSGLLLTYGLNTWLPRIMEGYGYDTNGSLTFLLILNGGAVVGALIGSKLADKFSPRPIIITTFTIAAASLIMMTFQMHLGLLLGFIVFAGVAVFGALMVALVPRQPEDKEREVDAASIDLTVKPSDLKTVKAS